MSRTHLPIVAADAAEAFAPVEPVVGHGEKLLQVGELASAVGKTVRAIHHYEELGLLEPDARSKGRFRLYDQEAVTRVRWIAKLHDLGLSLTQIQEVVATWEHAPSAGKANATIRSMYAEKLDETRAQIARLRDLERELEVSVAYLEACEPCDTSVPRHSSTRATATPHVCHVEGDRRPPEVGSCVTCEARERDQEPELVAGLLVSSRSGRARVMREGGATPIRLHMDKAEKR